MNFKIGYAAKFSEMGHHACELKMTFWYVVMSIYSKRHTMKNVL